MLSRRQYLTITMIMLVLLFMFQFTGVLKDQWNEYGTNDYAIATELDLSTAYEGLCICVDDEGFSSKDLVEGDFILYIGAVGDETELVAREWCNYNKRDYVSAPSLSAYVMASNVLPEYIFINSDYVDFDEDLNYLLGYEVDGVNLVFLNLPSQETITSNDDLMDLLGIYYLVEEEVYIESIEIADDFLLGEKITYEELEDDEDDVMDFDLTIPWYATRKGTKVYVMGIPSVSTVDYESLGYEYYPSIVWRKSTGSAYVYAINADYMETQVGLGILSAIVYESNDYSIYPVVNAQNLVFANYAALSSEFDEKLEGVYYRTQVAFFRDLVWPNIAAVWTASGDVPTVILNPALDYENTEEANYNALVYYMKLAKENSGEVGLGLYQTSSVSIADLLSFNVNYFNSSIPEYAFQVLYIDAENSDSYQEVAEADLLDNLMTLVYDEDIYASVLGYEDETVTYQRATNAGFTHTYSDDLVMRSLETSLGYSTILVDMSQLLIFDEDDETWEILSDDLSENIVTNWEDFEVFASTTLSESDLKIRRFLSLDYTDYSEDNYITLTIDNFDEEAYFILRTHGKEIDSISGATYEEISDGAYLLTITESYVEIYLATESGLSISF